MFSDLRYALRQLRKAPGFSLSAVLTLALGIGANTAIFSVVDAVLRHPAGVDRPQQLAVLPTRYNKYSLDLPQISTPVYTAARSLSGVVEEAALEQDTGFSIQTPGDAEHVDAARVSARWFQVYGARPILGRGFTNEEDQPHGDRVVVLSYGMWQRRFGGRSDVVGQTLMLDQNAYRVVGVMRSDFAWPRERQVWVPLALAPADYAPDHAFDENYTTVARLRPGVSPRQLTVALSTTVWEQLRRSGSGAKYAANSGWSVYATPLVEYAAGPLRTPLFVLSAVVALVLLIAAANVAGLLLARASMRTHEFSIRMALGASALRILRQVLLETALLAFAACIAGLLVGPLTGRALLRLIPQNLAAGYDVHPAPTVLAFTAIVALLTLLIAGFAPAAALLRQSRRLVVHEGGRGGTVSQQRQRLRRVFVISEVAAAFLLLSGTGLFLASLKKLETINPGFNPANLLVARVPYAGHDFLASQPRQSLFIDGVLTQLAAQPAVSSVAAADPLPFAPDALQSCSFAVIGRALAPGDPGPHSQLTLATPGYLQVMQIPLLAGRWFTADDLASTQRVAVIDQRLAAHYWPGGDAIGKQISFACDGRDKAALIVGVVATIRQSSLEADTSDGMRYYPFAQGSSAKANFLVRTAAGVAALLPAIDAAVARTDGSQAVAGISPMETLGLDSLAGRRLIVWMLAAFGGLALLLTVIGIYGLISYLTAQRTMEVGVRIALGAKRTDVLRLILRSSLSLTAAGLAIGAAASLFSSLLLRSIFAGFGAGTLASLVAAAAALLLVGTLAGMIPALRAANINPVDALRTE